MNFKEISEKYPKAWEKAQPYLTNSSNLRNLYDFFDSEGFFCNVYNTINAGEVSAFAWKVLHNINSYCSFSDELYYGRWQAEEDMFLSVFEIMEQILKGEIKK